MTMLQPLPSSSYRLNSCLRHQKTPLAVETALSKQSRTGGEKRVAFSKEGRSSSTHGQSNREAMAKAKVQARRKNQRSRPKLSTPQPRPEIPVIGSSCTWRDSELDHFNVKVRREVDVLDVIPEKFFDFKHLDDYNDCIFLASQR